MMDARARTDRLGHSRPQVPETVADLTGQVWGHPDPVYLYRWITGRNDLLLNVTVALQISKSH